LVFALGALGYDFGTEARRDSIMQHMKQPANPHDPNQLLAYLKENPWDAMEIIWTLNLDATPIYAIQPRGHFAGDTCKRLCQFLKEQLEEGVERVSIPGWIVGSARLSTGQVLPVIQPVMRGMYSWTIRALVEAVCGEAPAADAEQAVRDAHGQKEQGVRKFLARVCYQLRNLGFRSQDRAINYSATNALLVAEVFKDAIEEEMELDTIAVERSPICRPESDCWDVELTFFDPKKVFERARKVYRITVDVSDPVPVGVGEAQSWHVR
jgi:cyanobactin maturation PatA/PatG family protease